MSRDGSGNYALPAGNPVVTGTTITVTWANTSLGDIASALTASVARDGQSAMTGPLNMGSNAITSATTIAASGAVTAASLIPTSATVPANGMYLSAANTVAFATNSTLRASIDTSGNLVITGSLTGVNAVLSGSITAVGATLTGTILLGGVNVTDFARLSQTNTFLASPQTISKAGTAELLLQSTNASDVQVSFYTNSVVRGFLASPGAANSLVTGSAVGDIVARTQSGGFLFTGDGGTTLHFKVGTNGALTTPNARADEAGYKGLPQNSQAVDYTAVLADAGKSIYQTGASKTVTIPSNASVPFAIGTFLTGTFTNATGGTIAITSDTMTLAATTTTGSRTVVQNGKWTAEKQTATTWLIWGIGVS